MFYSNLQVTYKLGAIMFGCQHGRAPQYLIDYCLRVSDVASRQHLRSASRRLLVVPRHRLSTTVAGLLLWLARRSGTLFRIISGIRTLLQTTLSACWKRFCFQRTSATSALDVLRRCRCAHRIYILLTYLLTYLLTHKNSQHLRTDTKEYGIP